MMTLFLLCHVIITNAKLFTDFERGPCRALVGKEWLENPNPEFFWRALGVLLWSFVGSLHAPTIVDRLAYMHGACSN